MEIDFYKSLHKGYEIRSIFECFPNNRCIPMYLVHARYMSRHWAIVIDYFQARRHIPISHYFNTGKKIHKDWQTRTDCPVIASPFIESLNTQWLIWFIKKWMGPHEDTVSMTMSKSYSRMVFAQGFLPDGQSIIKQMSGLFVFVLIPAWVKGTGETGQRDETECFSLDRKSVV